MDYSEFLKINDVSLEGKTVLARMDFNVPLNKNGDVKNDERIRKALPTINHILDKSAKLILMSHLGRPKGKVVEELRLNSVAKKVSEIIGRDVKKLDRNTGSGVSETVRKMKPGDVVMLENVQFHPGERENSEDYARELASYGDVFVNDAFGQAHRNYASLVDICRHIPSCAGFLMQEEINAVSRLWENPEKPVTAIVAGKKKDKINVIKNLIPKVDKLIIGGVLANTFLKAKGINIGKSKFDEKSLGEAKDLIEHAGEKLVLPEDAVVTEEFDENAESQVFGVDSIPENGIIMDAGPKTIERYKDILEKSRTVLWGGPLGVFEFERFSKGSEEIARFLANSDITTIVGGGDSIRALKKFNLADKMTHVSTGGGAFLTFVSEGSLPAVEALKESKKIHAGKLSCINYKGMRW